MRGYRKDCWLIAMGMGIVGGCYWGIGVSAPFLAAALVIEAMTE